MTINSVLRQETFEMDFDIEAQMSVWVDERTPDKIVNSFIRFYRHGEKSLTIHSSDVSKLAEWIEKFTLDK